MCSAGMGVTPRIGIYKRRLGPVFAAMIPLCVFAAIYANVAWAGIVGWTAAVLLAVLWLVYELRRKKVEHRSS